MFKRNEEGIFGQNRRLYLSPDFRRERCCGAWIVARDSLFLDGKRNFDSGIVLKYPVVNHPQPLRGPVPADPSALNPIPYGK
jgi:hypothetical protein